MSVHSPSDLVAQARKQLLNIVSILKDGKVDHTIKAVIYGLMVYVKYASTMILPERKEYQDLLGKAIHLISLDTRVKEVCPEPISYTPTKEFEALATIRHLPELLTERDRVRLAADQEARVRARNERIEKGRQLLQQKYFEGAVQHFKRLIEDFPGDAFLAAQIGEMLFEINHIECITFFEKALESDPSEHKSLARMGVAFRKIKKFDQAENAYLRALDISADNVNYLFNLSRVYIDAGNWVKAQVTLRRVLEIDPNLEPARKGLGFATRHCRDLS